MPGSRVEEKGFAENLGFGLELTQHGGLGNGEREKWGRECRQRCGVDNDCGPFSTLTLICEAEDFR